MGKKGHSELAFRADLETDSIMMVYVKYDNGDYAEVKSYTTTDLASFVVPLKVKNADHFQLKLTGIGECKIHQIERKLVLSADI
jgi:hypothetical protein